MGGPKYFPYTIAEAEDALRRSGLGVPLSKAVGLILMSGGRMDGECVQFPRLAWESEVASGRTKHNYWDWAAQAFEASYGPIIQEWVSPAERRAMEIAVSTLIEQLGGDPNSACQQYPRSWWRDEVKFRDTTLGYWEWVVYQAEVNKIELTDLRKF